MNNSIPICSGCHCGEVSFQFLVPPEPKLLSCNCSICQSTGFLHLIVSHDNFELLNGKQSLTSYRFNTQQAEHLFCKHCGVKSFYQPRSHPNAWSINANCLPAALTNNWPIEPFDGKNWGKAYDKL